MATTLAASIIDVVMGLALGPAEPAASNRLSLEGLTLRPGDDGAFEIGMERLEAAALRVASGPLTLDIGQLALHKLVARVRSEGGRPRLIGLDAASAELSGVKVHGPLDLVAGQASPGSWSLGPLAAAEGNLRAEILDAHLLFDADVTVPIRQGRIDFRDTTVAHVGPDSRMGASHLGLYVDAPNGRSYLYQFPSAPVAGVEFEKRGAMLGPWVTDRGSLQLQAFAEWLLRQPASGPALGFTAQARQLFDRTAVSGNVQLGDGKFAAPGVQAEVAGRAEGRNAVRLHSEAVGRGLSAEMPSLSIRKAVWSSSDMQVRCDGIAGAFTLRLFFEGAQLRFAFDLVNLKLTGLRLHPKEAP